LFSPDIETLVVAEDDPFTLALITRQLTQAGYRVIGCANGRHALNALRRHRGGILLADWDMPEMTGEELCREVRYAMADGEIDFAFILLLSAHDETHRIVAGLEAGADDYLTKPYHRSELLARIRAGERVCKLNEQLQHAAAELKKLNRRLERLANTDDLTQVPNRRHLLERLQEAWSFADRHGGALGCFMFDIDRFKRINDTYGHAAGDAVLREVAAICTETVRSHDVVGRIGGEEFCIICLETDAAGLQHLSERVRTAIKRHRFAFDAREIAVSVSIGAVLRNSDHADAEALVAAADALMYRAKDGGRDQVWGLDAGGMPTRLTLEAVRA
jgi:diguanylate cyclase (GGDEF)-like protein